MHALMGKYLAVRVVLQKPFTRISTCVAIMRRWRIYSSSRSRNKTIGRSSEDMIRQGAGGCSYHRKVDCFPMSTSQSVLYTTAILYNISSCNHLYITGPTGKPFHPVSERLQLLETLSKNIQIQIFPLFSSPVG